MTASGTDGPGGADLHRQVVSRVLARALNSSSTTNPRVGYLREESPLVRVLHVLAEHVPQEILTRSMCG